jgi:hypothetical protein
MRAALSITVVVSSLLLLGCGSRPTEGDLTSSILAAADANADVTLSEDEAACIARVLLDSDLSDLTLTGLAADFSQPEVLEDEADLVEPLVAGAAQFCQGGQE